MPRECSDISSQNMDSRIQDLLFAGYRKGLAIGIGSKIEVKNKNLSFIIAFSNVKDIVCVLEDIFLIDVIEKAENYVKEYK